MIHINDDRRSASKRLKGAGSIVPVLPVSGEDADSEMRYLASAVAAKRCGEVPSEIALAGTVS